MERSGVGRSGAKGAVPPAGGPARPKGARRAPTLRTLFFAVALASGSWCNPVAGEVCHPQDGDYRVDVRIDIPPVTIRRDQSRADLGTMALHGPSYSVLGLTSSSLEAGTSTYYKHLPQDEGGSCFWVDRVEVLLRYESLDIYIASEYGPTSCPYQAILTHEEKHATVARTHLSGYVERVRSALSALSIPKPRAPLLVESVDRAQEKTQATIEALLKPVMRKLRETMREAQDEIDSREEYRRVQQQCARW